MSSSLRALVAGLTLVGVSACGGPKEVLVFLNFPSRSTFLYGEIGRIQAFELESDELDECPAIHARALGGTPAREAYLDTGEQPICLFHSGGVNLDPIDLGPKAFVGLVWDASNNLLMAGCVVVEVYSEGPDITIPLHMSEQYDAVVERINGGQGPLYADEQDKCQGSR